MEQVSPLLRQCDSLIPVGCPIACSADSIAILAFQHGFDDIGVTAASINDRASTDTEAMGSDLFLAVSLPRRRAELKAFSDSGRWMHRIAGNTGQG